MEFVVLIKDREYYLKIVKSYKVNKLSLSYISNYNLDDYICVKSTNIFRVVENSEVLEMKNAGYMLFKKEYYNKEEIENWIDYFLKRKTEKYFGCSPQYLSKPFPNFEITKKIRYK